MDTDWYDLRMAVTAQCELIDQCYFDALYADIEYTNLGGVTQMFQADPASLVMMMQTIIGSGGSLINGFVWGASDNVQVPFTFADLQGLAHSIYVRGNDYYLHQQVQKTAIRACTDVESVSLINW